MAANERIVRSCLLLPLLALPLCVLGAPSTAPATQPLSLPPEIARALNGERQALSPWVTVGWIAARDPGLTPREYAEETGFKKFNRDNTFIPIRHVRLTWNPDGRYIDISRENFQPAGTTKIVPRWNTVDTFDGKTFYDLSANPDEVHCLTQNDAENQPFDNDIDMDYFDHIGFPLPADGDSVKNHVAMDAQIYLLLTTGGAKLTAVDGVSLNNQQLVRLTIQRPADAAGIYSDEPYHFPLDLQATQYYYLDPNRDYAMVRHDNLDGNGTLTYRVDCSDFKAVSGRAIYLPRTIVTTEADLDAGQTQVQWTLKVQRIDFNPPANSALVLWDKTPGTWVYDLFGSTKKLGVVQANGSLKPHKYVDEQVLGMP